MDYLVAFWGEDSHDSRVEVIEVVLRGFGGEKGEGGLDV